MNTKVSKEEAIEALKKITEDHGTKDYFLNAMVVSNEGNWGVDLKVKREAWKNSRILPPSINKVHVCVLMIG